jgi:hypothetical protein
MDESPKLMNPNCGCGYRSGSGMGGTGLDAGTSDCTTGGTVIMVFFSILIGGAWRALLATS